MSENTVTRQVWRRRRLALAALLMMIASSSVHAVTLEELAAEVKRLSEQNRELVQRLRMLEAARGPAAPVATAPATTYAPVPKATATPAAPAAADDGVVRTSHQVSYQMLDPTFRVNRKHQLLLEKRQTGELAADSVYLGGAVTAIADLQSSNTDSKFGYLMRHPTSSNQRTKSVSEAVIHSAQLSVTGTMGDWITAYMEALYDPEQSFGSGTITALTRNQVQLRKGYVVFGNLDRSPFYAALGKMDVPFGLMDTFNPFTASTVWHAFGGLAYGLNAGYSHNGLNLRAMAIQGGAEFRAANTPVDCTSVPSKLNNYAIDASYQFDLGAEGDTLLVGASHIKGSAYCQDYPVTHFSECAEANGANGIYAQLGLGKFRLQGEIARTSDVWPGTFNPDIPEFAASKVTSFDIGGKYSTSLFGKPTDISLDFSRFKAGPKGAPWEKQDQIVLGLATFVRPTVKLFAELIHVDGYAPLNFISGGNVETGSTHSDRNAKSDIILFGANAAF